MIGAPNARTRGRARFFVPLGIVLICCTAVWGVAKPARADQGGATDGAASEDPGAEDLAQHLTGEAEALYMDAEYARAREKYQDAYHVSSRPELLFNIAQCHRKLGDHRSAVFFFDLYLQQRPDSPHRDLVESLVEESRTEVVLGSSVTSAAEPPAPQRERTVSMRTSPPFEATSGDSKDESQRLRRRRIVLATIGTVLVATTAAVLATTLPDRDQEPEPLVTPGVVNWQ